MRVSLPRTMKIPLIRWDKERPYRSLFDDIARVWTIGSIIYLLYIFISNTISPPIDLIFHLDNGKIEVLNEYKTLKDVNGVVGVNCIGKNYTKSFKFKFIDGWTTLPKGSRDFLISNDNEFLGLIQNQNASCPQGVLYVGRYYKNDTKSQYHNLKEVFSYELSLSPQDGKLYNITRVEHLNPVFTRFCSQCQISIQLSASNLKKIKIKNETFSFSTSWSSIEFPDVNLNIHPPTTEDTVDIHKLFFPIGAEFTPCKNLSIDDCISYFCKEINKIYPNAIYCKEDAFC